MKIEHIIVVEGEEKSDPLRYHDTVTEIKEPILAQFIIRNLENAVKIGLQRRAKRHGRSMEEEVREILRCAVTQGDIPAGGLGTEIASLFTKVGLASDIPELRGYKIIRAP